MANATVEQLKAFGLKHGEKVGIAVAGAVCLSCIALAAASKPLEITPDQVKTSAENARRNIHRNEPREQIVQRLEGEFLKVPDLAKRVEAFDAGRERQVASAEVLTMPWVTPPPGAGLIRETPELLAPKLLAVTPSRGGALMFLRDKSGDLIFEDDSDAAKDKPKVKRRRPRNQGAMGGMMGGAMGGMGGRRAPRKKATGALSKAEEAKQKEKEEQQDAAELVGGAEEVAKDAKGDAPEDDGRKEKEGTVGLRWMALTGTFPNKQQRELYSKALKVDYTQAAPNFQRLDVQRRELEADGSWGKWQNVDREEIEKVLLDLPELDEERTGDTYRLASLVDPLPLLKAGYYRGVHIPSMLDETEKQKLAEKRKEKDKKAKSKSASAAADGGADGQEDAMMAQMNAYSKMAGAAGRNAVSGYGAARNRGSMTMGGMGGAGGDANVPKSDADAVMVRTLDFTITPDETYQYRARVVVRNPNLNRNDVALGTDTQTPELKGPWSEPTDPITMPADVATYVLKSAVVDNANVPGERVQFQVARFNPDDGQTVVKTFVASPGEVVGEPSTAAIPDSEGKGVKSKTVDFTSRLVLLDALGGSRDLTQLPGVGGKFETPAVALMVRPDGALVVRNQANDVNDPAAVEMKENYATAIKNSTKKREKGSSFGGYGGGGMGGMGGYGGGMGGMGGGRR